MFNDEGDKFWVNEGIEQLRTLLKASSFFLEVDFNSEFKSIERYKSLHLTIVRVSWNKPDGKRCEKRMKLYRISEIIDRFKIKIWRFELILLDLFND